MRYTKSKKTTEREDDSSEAAEKSPIAVLAATRKALRPVSTGIQEEREAMKVGESEIKTYCSLLNAIHFRRIFEFDQTLMIVHQEHPTSSWSLTPKYSWPRLQHHLFPS